MHQFLSLLCALRQLHVFTCINHSVCTVSWKKKETGWNDTLPDHGTVRRRIPSQFFSRDKSLRCYFRKASHPLQQDHSTHVFVSSRWRNTGSNRDLLVLILFIDNAAISRNNVWQRVSVLNYNIFTTKFQNENLSVLFAPQGKRSAVFLCFNLFTIIFLNRGHSFISFLFICS